MKNPIARYLKENPMLRFTLSIGAILAASFTYTYSQTSFSQPKPIGDSAEYYMQKGLVEKQNGRRLESLKYFEKAESYDQNSRPITAELAAAYYDLRRYGQSREKYKKLESLGDNSSATLKKIMLLSFQLKQSDDVITYAAKLKNADPAEPVAYYVAKVDYDKDDYGEALHYLKFAALEDSLNAEIPYMQAHTYADMENYKQAVPYFQKAISMKPDNPEWIYELGLICYAMRDDMNALKYIVEAGKKGYKMDNDYMENLAIAYLNAGQLDSGIIMIRELLLKKPSDFNLLNMVAESLYDKKKYDDAITYWDKILEYDTNNAAALYMIGMCYQKKGGKDNLAKGIHLCDKAIEMDPGLSAYKHQKIAMGM